MIDRPGEPLLELLYQCCARVISAAGKGTGFFVAPGKLITCTHVLEAGDKSHPPVKVRYQQTDYPASITHITSASYPDLALLQVAIPIQHPCVLLGAEIDVDDPVHGYGFQAEYPGGEAYDGVHEGPSWLDDSQTQLLLKFSDAQIVPGFSGGPLLNRRTGRVCGVVKRTRGQATSLGGRAIPITAAIDAFGLDSLQAEYHALDRRWSEALEAQQAALAPVEASPQPARLDVLLFDQPDNHHARARLFGRQAIMAQANQWLDASRRLLLFGLAASGKTALAATLAQQRLIDNNEKYIWIQLKDTGAEILLDALARRFGSEKEQQEIRRQGLEGKIHSVRPLLQRSGVKLLVLDDAARGATLKAALQAAPPGMAVLVTSRTPYPTGNGLDEAQEIGDLDPQDALEMLVAASQRPALKNDPRARDLLDTLGCHPYSIEIAAYELRSNPARRPADLIEMIACAPHDLEMPGEFTEQGRESMKHLLDAIVNSLKQPAGDPAKDEKNRHALQTWVAFGALFGSGATLDLLARLQGLPTGKILAALDRLEELSLARQVPGSRYFDIHDLVFSYARALWRAANDEQPLPVLQAVGAFLDEHVADFDLLDSEIENLLGAASLARTVSPPIFQQVVYHLACGGYMDNYGHTLKFLELLDHAIQLERQGGDPTRLHFLLSKRGNAHFNRLQDTQALRCYQEALELAPDWYRQAVLLAVLGKTCARLAQPERAGEYFTRSHAVAEENRDPNDPAPALQAHAFILNQQTHAAGMQNDFEKVRSFAMQGLEVSMQVNDEIKQGTFLNNLGINELNQGASNAIAHHQQALQLGEATGYQQMIASAHYGLGLGYLILDQYGDARQHLLQARAIFDEIGEMDKVNLLDALAQVLQE